MELKDYQVGEKNITISIGEERSGKYRVRFVVKEGLLFSEVITNPAVYQFRGDEKYVRAKIIESNEK